MDIKFIDNGIVSILMKDYITESVEVFESVGNTIIAAVNPPAKKYVFEKDDID